MRSEVEKFAICMERQLRKNDHKGGWRACDIEHLLQRARQELIELEDAVRTPEPMHSFFKRAHIVQEAADVANFCMMISDVAMLAKDEEGINSLSSDIL